MAGCIWPGNDSTYLDYHDNEWGVPEYRSAALFEKLVLDGFQAGLSWITILKKRENFREAFADFNAHTISSWTNTEVDKLLQNKGIIRHRGKIEAAITNAQAYLRIEHREGFDNFLWNYVSGKPLVNYWIHTSEVPAQTPLSKQISRDLKKEGFKFCGPTIVYAFMQATGIVNDHLISCSCHDICQRY